MALPCVLLLIRRPKYSSLHASQSHEAQIYNMLKVKPQQQQRKIRPAIQ